LRRVVAFVVSAVASWLARWGALSVTLCGSQRAHPLWLAVSDLAGRQRGVVSVAQLRALGAGRSAITRRVQAGQLHRLFPGVYAVGHATLAREGRRCSPVGPARCSPTAARPCSGACCAPTRHASTSPPSAAATAPRESACTALVPSMPRTPPTMKVSRSRRSAARCLTSQQPCAARSSSGRSRRPNAYASTTTARSPTSWPDATGAEEQRSWRERRHERPSARATSGKRRSWSSFARPAARAADQRRLRRSGSRPPRARLPLAHAPSHRGDRRLGDPRHQGAFRADRAKDAALTASGYRVLRFTKDVEPELVVRRLRALLPTAGTRPRSGSPVR
jgi:putative AbiEi antitoxin of type IV toxin-antitoxin system